jgi:outer membrane protein insertion porin family
MSHYLENGYLTASFRADAEPLSADPHRFEVIYDIQEGPQVRTSNIVTIGNSITRPGLIERQTRAIKSGRLMTEREIFASEGRLYATGVFDWAEVSPRRQITTQGLEDVIVKLHESKRNAISYGLGYEIVNKGGTIPRGTVVFPGIPGVEFPDTFIVNQRRVQGPRASLLYTRTNLRGRGQTFTAGGIFGPLDRRATLSWDDPNFRWTEWMANLTATAESIRSNPLFNGQNGQIGFQLQRPINAKATRWAYLRYTFTRVNLTDLVIPELVPVEDRRERLSTFSGVLTHDTRDSALDPHTGIYESIEVNLNPSALGSSVNFGRLLSQLAIYRQFKKVVWANSLRIGLVQASSGSHVPISQKFFSGGGSTLRGLPLNGAGPQKVVTVCSNTADPSTCSLVHVPTGGPQLVILNSELRVPFPVRKGLTFAAFYDGGNVFESIGFSNFFPQYTNSVGVGLRYATVVGPVRVDVGRNLNPIPGIRATQVFVTVGQAF